MDESSNDLGRVGIREIVLILILGFVIRCFACQYTFIINPDGVYYIHQARAIYYGEWNSLTSCSINFLSNYPFFIAGAYALFHDWIVAAKSVSVFFGSITLIPLYLLCRRFFDRDISAMSTLVFALLPVFVGGSADVVRGPVCWFFIALGLYFFIKSDDKNYRLPLLFCCIFFLMASWARIEAILLVFMTCGYLLIVPQGKRIEKLAFFSMPLAGILLLIFCAMIFLNTPLEYTLRLYEIGEKFSAPIVAYEQLRAGLAELMNQPMEGSMPHFLHKARHLVWLVALGAVVKYMISAYFYLFFFIFLLGLGGVWHRIKEDRRVLYLILIAASAFPLLYLHVLQRWMMFDRFCAIFMLPSFIVIGFGLQKITLTVKSKFRLKDAIVPTILCFLILACSLPKNLKSKEADKIVYKEIAGVIADREGNAKEIKVVKSLRTPNWTPFYANLDYEGAPCPMTNFGIEITRFDDVVFKNYEGFVRHLKEEGAKYFLWEEGAWPKSAFDFETTRDLKDFRALGVWSHPDTGKMVLYSFHHGMTDG